MSTPRPDPATSSREELLRHLAVDPQIGLSGREADRRRDMSQAKPLFSSVARTFPQCLLAVFREPILWILLAVSLIALFFDRVSLGLVSLALTCGHILLCAVLLRRAERLNETMQKAYDAPLPRVLRSGRVCRVGADAVVPGDILLISRGDLIPADCRLLSTEHFSISERELDAAAPDRPPVILEKNADALPEVGRNLRRSPENMVFAGAVAESGFATAVVVAIGDLTHLGGLVGSIRPSHGVRASETKKVTAHLYSMISIILAILIIPLVTIGIFTLRDRYELMDICLSAVALATLALCEHTVARYAALTAAIRRDAATLRDTDNAADICGDTDAERLAVMTDLLLLGTAALHDGTAHPVELWTAGRTPVRCRCDAPDADFDAKDAVDLLFIWHFGRAALPAVSGEGNRLEETVGALLPALSEWAETDTEGLLLRFKDIEPVEGGGVRAVIDTPDGNRRLTIHISENCPARLDPRPAEAAEGFSSIFIWTSDNHTPTDTLRAVLSYAPRTSPKTAGWCKSMEAAGVRVVSLLSDVSEQNTRILTACGFCDRQHALRPDGAPRRMAAIIDEGVRAFEGCTDDEVADCIRDLQAEGRVVGVLSVDARDISHLNAADVAFTCSPSLFATAESQFLRPVEENYVIPDGGPDAQRAGDLCRRRADVIVRRSRPTGGGLGGVRTALLAADRMRTVSSAASGYLFLASAARVVFVLFSSLFGLLPIPAPLLLLSGFFVDAAVLYSLSHIPADTTPARRRSMTEALEKPWLTRKLELICLASAALLPWLVSWIARLAGAGIDKGAEGYAMLCLVALQTAVYVTLRPRRDTSGRKRTDRTYALTLLLLVFVYIGTLAAALVAGLHPLYALPVPPIPALLYMVATSVVGRLGIGKRH